MKMTKHNYEIVEKASYLIDLYFNITDDDEIDIDCSTDANGNIDTIAGHVDDYNVFNKEYVRYEIRLSFDDDGSVHALHIRKEGVVVGKQKM